MHKLIIVYKKLIIFFKYFFFNKKKTVTVLSDYETFFYIKKGYSVARFGDGELVYSFGFYHIWQKKNSELEKNLKNIFYNNNKNLLVCIPDFLYNKEIKRKNLNLKGWKLPFYCLNILLLENNVYGSSFIFRPFNSIQNNLELNEQFINYIKNKDIIYVGTDEYYKNFVKPIYVYNNIPKTNAYDVNYNKIINSINDFAKNKKNICVLITCGITGTLIAHDINKLNIQAIDIGSYFKQIKLGSNYK